MKQKAFVIIVKGLSLKQIRQFFGRWESNFNHVKPGRTFIFMKHFVSVVSSVLLPQTLIFNKMVFPASNWVSLPHLVVTAIFLITSVKQVSNSYVTCFNRIDFVVILSLQNFLECSKSQNCSHPEVFYFKMLTAEHPR